MYRAALRAATGCCWAASGMQRLQSDVNNDEEAELRRLEGAQSRAGLHTPHSAAQRATGLNEEHRAGSEAEREEAAWEYPELGPRAGQARGTSGRRNAGLHTQHSAAQPYNYEDADDSMEAVRRAFPEAAGRASASTARTGTATECRATSRRQSHCGTGGCGGGGGGGGTRSTLPDIPEVAPDEAIGTARDNESSNSNGQLISKPLCYCCMSLLSLYVATAICY